MTTLERPTKDGRPLRLCDSCLVVDNHPRHVYGTTGRDGDRVTYTNEASNEAFGKAETKEEFRVLSIDMADDTTQMKHLDCCVADGCPDGTCDRRLADSIDPFDGGKTTGPALIKKLEAHVAAMTQKEA